VTGREKAQRKIKDSEMNQGTIGILDEQGESCSLLGTFGLFFWYIVFESFGLQYILL
jgi:hypothetical protein